TLRTWILSLFSMRFGGHWDSRSHRGDARRRGAAGAAPREQAALQERQQPAKKERREADGDNTGVHALHVEHLAGRFHHVSDPFARVDPLRQDYIGPADVVEDFEGAENRGERGAE